MKDGDTARAARTNSATAHSSTSAPTSSCWYTHCSVFTSAIPSCIIAWCTLARSVSFFNALSATVGKSPRQTEKHMVCPRSSLFSFSFPAARASRADCNAHALFPPLLVSVPSSSMPSTEDNEPEGADRSTCGLHTCGDARKRSTSAAHERSKSNNTTGVLPATSCTPALPFPTACTVGS